MFSDDFVRRHRLSGLANGILIGMGITFLLAHNPFGIVSIVIGVLLEYWQRKRIPKTPGPGGEPPNAKDT